jgi:hypothetical protein
MNQWTTGVGINDFQGRIIKYYWIQEVIVAIL